MTTNNSKGGDETPRFFNATAHAISNMTIRECIMATMDGSEMKVVVELSVELDKWMGEHVPPIDERIGVATLLILAQTHLANVIAAGVERVVDETLEKMKKANNADSN